MAVCAEVVGTGARRYPHIEARSGRVAAVALALAAGALLTVQLDAPGLFDNEGRYAAVAREMLLRGDYVTPYIDGTLFLNKPPLTFWLAALVFRVCGLTEWVRLVAVAAAMVTLVATCRLGALLYGEVAGLVAGLMLATTIGFVLEARTLRPDLIVTASIVVALLCWRHATGQERPVARWLCGLYAALGVGMLAKGLVPVILAGLPIVLVTVREHGWRRLRALRPGLGIAVVATVALPWHVLVTLEHPGFAWDYVVNQHLLFFLGRKPTRDSFGDPLLWFWGTAILRTTPWLLLAFASLREGVRGWAQQAAPVERVTLVPWTLVGGVMLFFSVTPERLEHYAIPVLPGVALLAARGWQRLRSGSAGRAQWLALTGAGVVLVGVGLAGVALGPRLLAHRYWLTQIAGLAALIRAAAAIAVVTGALLAMAAVWRRAGVVLTVLAVGMLVLAPIVLRAQTVVSPLFSWRLVAAAIRAQVAPATAIVFESPGEYQLVGGLAFYTGRSITLLEPPGFVRPTYLEGERDSLFLDRAEFERRWRTGMPLVVVSDPLQRRDAPDGIAPTPFTVLARVGDRWVLTNLPAGVPR